MLGEWGPRGVEGGIMSIIEKGLGARRGTVYVARR